MQKTFGGAQHKIAKLDHSRNLGKFWRVIDDCSLFGEIVLNVVAFEYFAIYEDVMTFLLLSDIYVPGKELTESSLFCFHTCSHIPPLLPYLGVTTWTKFDEFSENFQTASDPPPLFSEKNVALLSGKLVPVALSLYRKSTT